MNNIYYCFISHQSVIVDDSKKIADMMNHLNLDKYIIVYGGSKSIQIKDDHIVSLSCSDNYCGLPDKINKTLKHMVNNYYFDYVVKFDRTVQIKKGLDLNLNLTDYCGAIVRNYVSCGWHYNRCPDSIWNQKEFVCDPIIYALGLGYILSRNAASVVAQDNEIYQQHVYEDVYIGHVMQKNNYKPKVLHNMKDYFFDPDHAYCF